jgi:DNA-binding beta-propeller fold protein YncE
MKRSFLVVLVAFAVLPGIAVATARPAATSLQRFAHPAGGWIAPDADPNHAWLYVSNASAITAYDIENDRFRQVEKITSGISSPGGIALDAAGVLYVPNENAATVTVYPPGATTPSLTLTGTDAPEGVAVDMTGNVFVCNRGSKPGISVYAPGETEPAERITSELLQVPDQLLFDAGGTLYITDTANGVLTLAPGSQTLQQLHLGDLPVTPSGLAIDPATGNIYVSGATQPPDFLSLYQAGQADPTKTRRVEYGGLDFLETGMFHKKAVLFAPDSQGPFVDAFRMDLKGKPLTIPIASKAIAVSVAYKAPNVP